MNSSSRLVRKRFKCLKCKHGESQLVSTMQFNVKCSNCGGLLNEISENEYKLLKKRNKQEGEKNNNEPIRPDKNIFHNYSNVYNRPPSHKKTQNSNNNINTNTSMNNSRYNNFRKSNQRNSNANIPRMNREREREIERERELERQREREREREREMQKEREREERGNQRRRFQSQNHYGNSNNYGRNERYNNNENENNERENQNRANNIFSNFFNFGNPNNNNNENNNFRQNHRFRDRSVDPNQGRQMLFGNLFSNLFGLMTGLGNPMTVSQPQIISFQGDGSPVIIRVIRQNVDNDVFDQSFLNFGSNFNGSFRDNFSSNFRSNLGNFFAQLIEIVRRNREEAERNKHPPTKKEALEKLKRFPMSDKYCKKDKKGKIELPQCCICLTDIGKGEETVLLPCGHMFHWQCCLTWLKSKNTCPVCRFELPGERS